LTRYIWGDGYPVIFHSLLSELSLFCNEAMEILWGEHKVNFKIKVFHSRHQSNLQIIFFSASNRSNF
jgi:hypothetical protein